MKRRLFVPLLIAALVLALGTLAAACGGGGDGRQLSLEEYLQRLETARASASQRSDALGEEFTKAQASASTEEEWINALRDYVNGVAAIMAEVITDLNSLNPPAEAGEAHNELVNAWVGARQLWDDFVHELGDVNTRSESDELLSGLDEAITQAGARIDQACFAMPRDR